MKNWSDYFDSNGLLTQKDKDGGDTPSHESFAWTMAKLDPSVNFPSPISFKDFINLIVLDNGLIIRNPTLYNDPSDSSRDQYRALAVTMTLHQEHPGLQRLVDALPRRTFLNLPYYPNGDVFTPEDRAVFDRDMMANRNAYCLALLADLFTLLGTLVLCFWNTREPGLISRFLGRWFWFFIANSPPNDQGIQGDLRGPSSTSNDLDQIQICIQGAIFRPTFLNRLSRWVYGNFRPNGIQWALNSYFADENDPPVNELARNVIPRYFT